MTTRTYQVLLPDFPDIPKIQSKIDKCITCSGKTRASTYSWVGHLTCNLVVIFSDIQQCYSLNFPKKKIDVLRRQPLGCLILTLRGLNHDSTLSSMVPRPYPEYGHFILKLTTHPEEVNSLDLFMHRRRFSYVTTSVLALVTQMSSYYLYVSIIKKCPRDHCER